MSDNSDDSVPSRRTVLQGSAGALAATAAGSSTVAAASGEESLARRRRRLEAKREMPGRYDDGDAREAFEKFAGELLRSLADEGLIGSASLDAFSPVEEAPSTDLDAEAKTAASGKLAVEGDLHDGSGEKTAVIKAHTVGETHEIGVHVLPEADFAFVVAVPIDDGRRMYADNSNPELGGVSTADSCSGDLCRKTCSGAPGAPFVIYSQSGGACANTCVDYSPPCSKCDNQDKCNDDSGW
jgi:hypothetical protein